VTPLLIGILAHVKWFTDPRPHPTQYGLLLSVPVFAAFLIALGAAGLAYMIQRRVPEPAWARSLERYAKTGPLALRVTLGAALIAAAAANWLFVPSLVLGDEAIGLALRAIEVACGLFVLAGASFPEPKARDLLAIARQVVEEHLDLCLFAGINHEGINAEVAKGQWEFQIFGKGSRRAADEMWMARYLMLRLTEKYGVDIEFHCKPLGDTDWNGSGMHANFSTKYMREVGGKEYFEKLMDAFKVMSAGKLVVEYTNYKPLNSTTVQKIPKLLVAMMTDRAFE